MLARYHFIPKLCWHQNMTVTSVKSMKYLHSTAHEALDVWQLHTEDETPPPLCTFGIGSSLVPIWRPYTGSKGSRGSRQLLQRTLNTMIWKHIMMSSQCVPHHLLQGGLIILEWQVQLIQNGDRCLFCGDALLLGAHCDLEHNSSQKLVTVILVF